MIIKFIICISIIFIAIMGIIDIYREETRMLIIPKINQNIILEDVNLLEDNFNLKNPIISSKDIKVDFSIPNGGSLKNNSFEWDNLDFENNLIKIPFES